MCRHVMTSGETYLLGAGYLIFLLVPISIISLTMKNRRCSGPGFKCIKLLLLPVLQVIAVTTFTLALAPVMLGMAEKVSWRLPWRMVSSDIKLGLGLFGFLGLIAAGIMFIPVLGRLYSS